ncbi:hypothetical protein [Acinetobacter haemolyticus]|uniref:hypothetical protein n=1 Tax=Acinetobacter haemolyticus TaxID=29430 RepID=UPI0021CDE0C1|nr:hypothetical protein [Acinetobacter haemolyticus]MCU4377930.1 hypothetical protein [Acinetobacter haemolyticus]
MLKIFKWGWLILVGVLLISCSDDIKKETDIKVKNIQFELDGVNGIKVNSSFDSAKLEKYTEEIDGCFLAKEVNSDNGISYEVSDGFIKTIRTSEQGILSPYGVAVGDHVDQIYKKHPSNLKPKVEDNENGLAGENIFIYFWNEPNQQSGLKYSVDSDIVTSISMGTLMDCI